MTEGKKQSIHAMRTTRWSITYWLTEGRTQETLETLVQAMPGDWALEGQIEKGTDSEGKLHAQLFLKTPQTRGSRILKFFPNSHIEEARNAFALQNYVHKDDTRVAEFKTVENRSPQWRIVRDKFYDWLVETKQATLHLDELEKYHLWDRFIILSLKEKMEVDLIGVNPQYRSCINKYWEAGIHNALEKVVQEVDVPTTLSSPPPVDKKDRQTKGPFKVRSPPP